MHISAPLSGIFLYARADDTFFLPCVCGKPRCCFRYACDRALYHPRAHTYVPLRDRAGFADRLGLQLDLHFDLHCSAVLALGMTAMTKKRKKMQTKMPLFALLKLFRKFAGADVS